MLSKTWPRSLAAGSPPVGPSLVGPRFGRIRGPGAHRLDGRIRFRAQSDPARVFVEALRRSVEGVGDSFDGARMRVGWSRGLSRRCGRSSGVEVNAPFGEPGGAGQASFGRFGRLDEHVGVAGCVEPLSVTVQLVDLPGEGFSFGPAQRSFARISKLLGEPDTAVRLAWREAVEREDGFGGVLAGAEGVERAIVRALVPQCFCLGDVADGGFRVRGEAAQSVGEGVMVKVWAEEVRAGFDRNSPNPFR